MKQKIKVGIIAAPERSEDIIEEISDTLAKSFSKQIDQNIDWQVDNLTDPLTGAAEASQDILYNATYIKREKQWDYAICLTDLPIFYNKNIVAADLSFEYNVAQISIPAFGWPPMKERIRKTIILLLSELYTNAGEDRSSLPHSLTEEKQYKEKATHLFKRRFPIIPVRRQQSAHASDKYKAQHTDTSSRTDQDVKKNEQQENKKNCHEANDNHIDIRFVVYPNIYGHFRLILGMTFANNPMKIMSSFKNVIAIAFSTGAFALIFPTIWNLAQFFSIYRLGGLMVSSILGLVIWIIVAHNLWEYPSKRNKPSIRRLYNLATSFTLIIDVVAYYSIMFVLFLITCLLLIPPGYFEAQVMDNGQAVLVQYLRVAWAAASLSTIVSAIGAGLANEDLVRNITYGYRQRERNKQMNQKNK